MFRSQLWWLWLCCMMCMALFYGVILALYPHKKSFCYVSFFFLFFLLPLILFSICKWTLQLRSPLPLGFEYFKDFCNPPVFLGRKLIKHFCKSIGWLIVSFCISKNCFLYSEFQLQHVINFAIIFAVSLHTALIRFPYFHLVL